MEGTMKEPTLDMELNRSILYKELKNRCSSSPTLSSILTLVNEVAEYSIDLSKAIIINMPEYTLHDEKHLFNMLYLAGKLIPKEKLVKISTPDLMMIILSIFLHDIGMSPKREVIMAWKNQLGEERKLEFEEEINAFERFKKAFIHELEEIDSFNNIGEYSKAQLILDYIVTQYIRMTHADRARKIIEQYWNGKIKYHNIDLTADLAEICFSHNEGHTALLDMETTKLCGEDTYLCLPFVAVVLRLTDIMDFDTKRTPSVLFSHLAIKDPVSLSEWLKHQSVSAWSFGKDTITFSAQCSHPAIEATIRGFCDLIDDELRNCTLVLANLYSDICDVDCYKIKLPAYVNRKKISAKRDIVSGKPIYIYHDTKFTLNKKQVIDLLMGTKLYGNPEVAIRELLQNSIDACLLRKSLSVVWKDNYNPYIKVTLDTQGDIDYLIIEDNGIGMNQNIVDNYYTNIGKSYYTSTEFLDLMAETNQKFKPISRFGIGILACFMVCDSMKVETKKICGPYSTDEALKISIEGYDSLFVITNGIRTEPGTKTTLKLRKTHPWQRMSKEDFVNCVKKLIPLPPFNIEVKAANTVEICAPDSFMKLDLKLDHDYTWSREDNIKTVSISLDCPEQGFSGKAEIAFIVSNNGEIMESLDICKKNVEVDGNFYTLSSSISYADNCIHKHSINLEIDENASVQTNSSYREINNSASSISIHGINVPCSLFRNYTNYNQKAVLELPFPIRFRLDIGSTNDLNLNSTRTQIIYDNVWLKFEKQFISTVCIALKENVGDKSWKVLKDIFIKKSKNEEFCRIIKQM
ncbi:MAG: metal-dependent phosphohydrolase [Negativicutes bacterium]|nr:metal-dependent phosphohydrolase [Negativicutes bacterium]